MFFILFSDFEVLRAEVEEILVVLENETSVAFWGGRMLISPTCLYIACLMCVCRNVLFLCCDVIMWCAFGCCLAWSHHTCVSVLRTV